MPSKNTDYKTLSATLDDILNKLQTADLDLDEAVALYEQGMTITGQLEAHLKDAENKVSKIKASLDNE